MSIENSAEYVLQLEKRIRELELSRYRTNEALDLVLAFNETSQLVRPIETIHELLSVSAEKVQQLVTMDSIGFFLLDEEGFAFPLTCASPESSGDLLRTEIGHQIESGAFGAAMRQSRLLLVPASDGQKTLALNPLATSSRVIGMFAGIVANKDKLANPLYSKLLSSFLGSVSQAVENLYLNSASKAKTDFVANMSHEIRTPLNGILGLTEVMLLSELTEEQEIDLRTIRSCGVALKSIISDVLDFSKI
jgi:K+-sensing histidine kinase KdpD